MIHIHNNVIQDDEDAMIGWLEGHQQQPELNKPGLPSQSASIVANDARVDAEQWEKHNIPR